MKLATRRTPLLELPPSDDDRKLALEIAGVALDFAEQSDTHNTRAVAELRRILNKLKKGNRP